MWALKGPGLFFYKVLTFREIELCQCYLCTDKLISLTLVPRKIWRARDVYSVYIECLKFMQSLNISIDLNKYWFDLWNSQRNFFHWITHLVDKKNSVDAITADLCKQVDLRLYDILNKIEPYNINMACITQTKVCQTDRKPNLSIYQEGHFRFDYHFLILPEISQKDPLAVSFTFFIIVEKITCNETQ